jgi:rubrerythrin
VTALTDNDAELLQEALGLELQAIDRYVEHAASTEDPRFIVYWEALRRNETDHRDALRRLLTAGGRMPIETPASGDLTGAEAGAGVNLPDTHAAGFRSIAATLRDDCLFERAAVRVYGRAAAKAGDHEVKALFRELARGEAGHSRGLRRHLESVARDDFPVVLLCPMCGWPLDLGPAPQEGTEVACPMCPGRFRLASRDGDWRLDRIAAPP